MLIHATDENSKLLFLMIHLFVNLAVHRIIWNLLQHIRVESSATNASYILKTVLWLMQPKIGNIFNSQVTPLTSLNLWSTISRSILSKLLLINVLYIIYTFHLVPSLNTFQFIYIKSHSVIFNPLLLTYQEIIVCLFSRVFSYPIQYCVNCKFHNPQLT